jgi:hypothetical protein
MDVKDKELESSATYHLEALPHSLLAEISTFIGANGGGSNAGSDVLLAVALTASQSSWGKCQCAVNTQQQLLSPASKAVLSFHSTDDWGKRFEKFDFGHYQKECWPNKLNDIDLKAILICIDAKNNTKSLKLTGCPNISGRGMEPLMGCTVLERIDLNMGTRAMSTEDIGLSEAVVLPMLRTFLGQQSSLRHVNLPLQWKKEKSSELTAFLGEYNEFLESLQLSCQQRHCENESEMGMHVSGDRYGIQCATCFNCLKHFCVEEDCGMEFVDPNPSFEFCPKCQKYFCNACNHIQVCVRCPESSCFGCFGVHLCQRCYSSFCMSCKMVSFCSKCFTSTCIDCEFQQFCSKCYKTECNDCSEMIFCAECYKSECSDCSEMMCCSECYTSFCGECAAGKIHYENYDITCNKCYDSIQQM